MLHILKLHNTILFIITDCGTVSGDLKSKTWMRYIWSFMKLTDINLIATIYVSYASCHKLGRSWILLHFSSLKCDLKLYRKWLLICYTEITLVCIPFIQSYCWVSGKNVLLDSWYCRDMRYGFKILILHQECQKFVMIIVRVLIVINGVQCQKCNWKWQTATYDV